MNSILGGGRSSSRKGRAQPAEMVPDTPEMTPSRGDVVEMKKNLSIFKYSNKNSI